VGAVTAYLLQSHYKQKRYVGCVSERMALVPEYCKLPISAFPLLYGTAWKEDRTTDLCTEAFKVGFKGVDTACQPKHYQEHLVGDALQAAFTSGTLKREETWIQTKFTSLRGQDPNRIPYDKRKSLAEQVKESVQVSRKNLKVETIDSLVLHSPERDLQTTLTVWNAMEEAVNDGFVRHLGISNCYDLNFLVRLWNAVNVKPVVVQNRFYEQEDWDRELRKFCLEKKMMYQSFWTLTANPGVLRNPVFREMAKKRSCTPSQLMYKFLVDVGCQPLSGTTTHQAEAAQVMGFDFVLTSDEIATIDSLMVTRK